MFFTNNVTIYTLFGSDNDLLAIKQQGGRYLTGAYYTQFIETQASPAIKRFFEQRDEEPIFQDDQDRKQRTQQVLTKVSELFQERIVPQDGDAKFADVWPIENVWGAIKTKLTGKSFASKRALITAINKAWRTFTPETCSKMMAKIPKRLYMVIKKQGEQVYGI